MLFQGLMTKRIREVTENMRISVKTLPNSQIYRNIHELDSIEVNKGRIYRIKVFLGILWNLIKYDDEMRWKIRDFDRYGNRAQRQIHGIKYHSIWIKIRREIE